jgi:hypothetical protein
LIAPTTRSGSSSGSDKTLCTPSGPLRGPNRGHRGSPPNDPTFGCAGIAPPAGTAPHPARTARPSTAWTNSALATTVCARSSSSMVSPAPSAPGMACTANSAMSVNVSLNGRCRSAAPIVPPGWPSDRDQPQQPQTDEGRAHRTIPP